VYIRLPFPLSPTPESIRQISKSIVWSVFLLYSLPLLMASAGTCRKRIAVNRLHGTSMSLIEYCIETSVIAGWRRDIPVLNPLFGVDIAFKSMY
jgi:hypothetical protein